jgi:hypothetical protein
VLEFLCIDAIKGLRGGWVRNNLISQVSMW